MTLNKREVDAVVDAMLYLDAVTADVGQVEVEADDGHRELYEDEPYDDGQPSEYDEWQDYYGGDDSHYEHDCDCMFDC